MSGADEMRFSARHPGVRAYSAEPRRPELLADCAPSGRMRLDALACWLQDVAYADVQDAGMDEAAVWVVRRTRIRVNRFPRFGERFDLTTFCSGLGRMWAERRTDIVTHDAGAGAVLTVRGRVPVGPSRQTSARRLLTPRSRDGHLQRRCLRPEGDARGCAIPSPDRQATAETRGPSARPSATSPTTSTMPPTGSRSRRSCSAGEPIPSGSTSSSSTAPPSQAGRQAGGG